MCFRGRIWKNLPSKNPLIDGIITTSCRLHPIPPSTLCRHGESEFVSHFTHHGTGTNVAAPVGMVAMPSGRSIWGRVKERVSSGGRGLGSAQSVPS